MPEKIDFIEEEDDAGPHAPPGVDYGVEENQAFHHAVLPKRSVIKSKVCGWNLTDLITSLEQHLIVLAERHAENDGRDVFEAMNPLLTFAALASYVKHAVCLYQHDSGAMKYWMYLTVCSIDPSGSVSSRYPWSLSLILTRLALSE